MRDQVFSAARTGVTRAKTEALVYMLRYSSQLSLCNAPQKHSQMAAIVDFWQQHKFATAVAKPVGPVQSKHLKFRSILRNFCFLNPCSPVRVPQKVGSARHLHKMSHLDSANSITQKHLFEFETPSYLLCEGTSNGSVRFGRNVCTVR
jgi:hypothetical protein